MERDQVVAVARLGPAGGRERGARLGLVEEDRIDPSEQESACQPQPHRIVRRSPAGGGRRAPRGIDRGPQRRPPLERVGRHHRTPEREQPAFVGGERTGDAREQVEQLVPSAGRRVVELIDQRRNEVEGRPHGRMALEVERHVEVVLGRVQAHPRQSGAPADRIAIVGLVVVPEEQQVDPCGSRAHGAVLRSCAEISARRFRSRLRARRS